MIQPRMAMSARRSVSIVAVSLILSTVVAACTAEPPGPSVSPVASASARPTPSPSAAPVTFRSSVYPFELSLSAGVARGAWHPATERWDGVAEVDHGAATTDYVAIDDGDLFVYGTPWNGDLEAFAGVVNDNGVKYHGCAPRPDATALTVAQAPALLYAMLCSGQPAARVVLVRDGFGLVIAQLAAGGGSGPVDRLVERAGALIWTKLPPT